MVGIMKVQIGGNYTETTVEPIYAEYVSKQDFDRAISLLRAQNEALKHEAGVKTTKLPAEHDQNYPADKSDLDAIRTLVKKTEEFLEECK